MQLHLAEKRKFLILVSFLLLAIFVAGCNSEPYVSFGKTKVKVEIADTIEEMSKGLMYRDSLGKNKGMLFIFPEESTYAFWMKNVKFSLDIIFIDNRGKVVDIISADPCNEDSCDYYLSNKPAKYALEVNKGFAGEHNININDLVQFKGLE